MKIYHVSAYYKQGDDLAAFLAKHKSPCKALEKWGQHIIKIGQQVITLASFLESKSGVFVEADTHEIRVSCSDESLMRRLVKIGLLVSDEKFEGDNESKTQQRWFRKFLVPWLRSFT